jgi:hypothetical protein
LDTIKISATQEPSLVQVVVSVITKSGQYLDKSQARYLIGNGEVYVNGLRIRDIGMELEPGTYSMKIRNSTFQVEVSGVERE